MSEKPWPPRSEEKYFQEAQAELGAELVNRFRQIEALVFDADGVLTSGKLYYGPTGEALKDFHSHDGLGLVMARFAGLKLAVLTGRDSPIVAGRATELHFDAIQIGRFDKVAALGEILETLTCSAGATLYLGDDLVDLPALYQVGLPVAVPAAPAEVKENCLYVTQAAGGNGAVREVIDLVLKCRRLYGVALQRLAGLAGQPSEGAED
jgi:3-deoxy-D-manno-octulosonate 8-phosphate phosphatase (KDO 8-P phosphatase)